MHAMTVELVSVTPAAEAGQVLARGRATATDAQARIWIELTFQPQRSNVWDEAYDRLLELLDIA